MKNILTKVIASLIIVTCIVFGFLGGINLDEVQKKALVIICIIAGSSAVYCFIVGEISRNNSQMDKFWSILPIVYAWVVTYLGGFSLRLVIMSVLISLWGIRLTYNFAKKGAYSIKFWEGEEDYRWKLLRQNKIFSNKLVWALFDLFFISSFQNALVVAICFPMVALMSSTASFGVIDIIATILTLFFIIYETIADNQQRKFQTYKWALINSGKKLEELEAPYNKGFNTFGLWNRSRHPNYLAEQMIWICLYMFVIGAGVVSYGIFNWTIVGPMVLVLLFMGSSTLAESISAKKYLEYKEYQEKTFKYLPIFRYRKSA